MQSLRQLFQSTFATPINNSLRALAELVTPSDLMSLRAITDLVAAMSESYLIIYKDDTWRNELGRYSFEIISDFISWPDSQKNRLSSFKFKLPIGWELRIHEDSNSASRFKAWRSAGGEVCVNKSELPKYLHDNASGHRHTRPNNQSIKQAFDAIAPDYPAELNIVKPITTHMPEKFNDNLIWHQQGLQKTPRGELVVSGSTPETGYIYMTNPELSIVNVFTPNCDNFNHLGGCQVVDDFLAVGYERLENEEDGVSKILFYNIRNIMNPVPLNHLTVTRPRAGDTAGAVGLIFLGDCWLVVVTNWDAAKLDFYTSSTPDLMNLATYFNNSPKWSWAYAQDHLASGSVDNKWECYQNINIFCQIGKTPRLDDLWLIGMHTNELYLMADWADLYHLSLASAKPLITKVDKKQFHNSGDGQRFLYASGFYFDTKTGSFEVYASEAHIRDGTVSRINRWI